MMMGWVEVLRPAVIVRARGGRLPDGVSRRSRHNDDAPDTRGRVWEWWARSSFGRAV